MLRLYMDVHIPGAVTRGLRLRGIDVLTAQEDGTDTLPDPQLLDRATALGCVLFTQDDDLLVEAATRQEQSLTFGGVIYLHQRDLTIGRCIDDLELIATVCSNDEMVGQVRFLPLR